MHHHMNRNRYAADIWTQRNVVLGCIGLVVLVGIMTWMILRDTTAEAHDLSHGIESLAPECRGYASMSLRLAIIANSGPIDRDQAADILDPIAELDLQECIRINEQMDAIVR